MTKMYLIEHSKTEYSHNGLEFKVKDSKQVEVLEKAQIDKMSILCLQSELGLRDYLAANNLQIIKTVK